MTLSNSSCFKPSMCLNISLWELSMKSSICYVNFSKISINILLNCYSEGCIVVPHGFSPSKFGLMICSLGITCLLAFLPVHFVIDEAQGILFLDLCYCIILCIWILVVPFAGSLKICWMLILFLCLLSFILLMLNSPLFLTLILHLFHLCNCFLTDLSIFLEKFHSFLRSLVFYLLYNPLQIRRNINSFEIMVHIIVDILLACTYKI